MSDPKQPERDAEAALRASLALMRPLVRWLLRSGVQYGTFATALKRVFVEIAREELERAGRRPTDSALSVLSGVHRKDVRAFGEEPDRPPALKSVPLASQVFTRWLTQSRWRDAQGRPRTLARTGARRSFEALAREVSSDVHPRTLLDELERIGLVRIEGDEVSIEARGRVPADDRAEMTELFVGNVGDHMSAAVRNLTTGQPRLLEQSIFAHGLSEASAVALGDVARTLWAETFDRMVTEATQRIEADADTEAPHRMRFGVYFFHEPQPGAAPGDDEDSQ